MTLSFFVEASVGQVEIINKVLTAFCDSSGQKVNKEKTRIFFSKNVGHTVKDDIRRVLQFSIMQDLKKYLGVLILHSRVTKNTYNDIIIKLQSRLNNWKASSLSLVGRNFLWGETENVKKVHLVNWKKVNMPKAKGGLGIRHARTLNHAFMMKVGWGLVERRDSLWAKVLRTKYKCGDWDLKKIHEWILEDWVSKIAAMAPPSPWKNADQAAWDPSIDGMFTVKSAYEALNTDLTENDRVFRFVLDWKGPERIRTFLWLLANDALLINHNRRRRNMTSEADCPRCNSNEETVLHAFKDCPIARLVWQALLSHQRNQHFFSLDIRDWLCSNLEAKDSWPITFGVGVSSLWYLRNKVCF
ncbi:hypothetical protein AHAS_Ahas12G0029800 [Arachis hypogaea]